MMTDDEENEEPNELRSGEKMQLPVIEELNIYVNSKNAKLLATLIVICFIIYHGFLHFVEGGDSCSRLLSDGRFQGSMVWQPYGCMLHTYSNSDARRCLRYVSFLKQENSIVFVGDSRIRQLYEAVVRQVAVSPPISPLAFHSNLHYNETNLRLNIDFLWQPVLNKSFIDLFGAWKHNKTIPKLIVIGSATHSIKKSNGSSEALEEFKQNLKILTSSLNALGNRTRVVWTLQDPVVVERLKASRAAITNEQIDLYNMAAMERLYGTTVHIWSSSRLIAQGSIGDFTDGMHAGSVALKYKAQILMNLYCNDHLNFNDGTCCNTREKVTIMQGVTFTALCTCLIIMVGISIKRRLCITQNVQSDSNLDGSVKVPVVLSGETNGREPIKGNGNLTWIDLFMTLGKLALIMGYFFLCDRTSLFMKENKYYSHLNFWLPLCYMFALGLFFTEDTSQTQILHRHMTDEWKGWMQLVILVYHMTGASQVLPIYMHIRVLVSSYLFLTGFGHFTYYFTGRDMGLVRYCQVMFRINFITILLCLVMNRPYQFYYFVPLISFWYSVMHVTLVLPPRLIRPPHPNSEPCPLDYIYAIVKFVALGGVVTVLYMSEVFFEKIFVMRAWKLLFVTSDDDIHEWWFRWQLDRYSLLYGMIFALLYITLTQVKLIDDKSSSNLLSGRLAFLVSLIGVIGIGSYTSMAVMCGNKPYCNEIHPYVTWVPILGFIILRNMVGALRTRYSSFFAWFGTVSLELFVCQYHGWLAADTHGVLVLVPSYPVANVLVTSFVFTAACHELHRVTEVLASVFVPNDVLRAGRNLGILAFMLLAVAVHDGVF